MLHLRWYDKSLMAYDWATPDRQTMWEDPACLTAYYNIHHQPHGAFFEALFAEERSYCRMAQVDDRDRPARMLVTMERRR